MAEIGARDRLHPSLLDRLLDHEPQSKTEGAQGRVLSRQQLRAAVLRDLSWLFNATRPEPEPQSEHTEELARWRQAPLACDSVLNFGLPAFAGVTLASMDMDAIRRTVVEAVRRFEPRIDAQTLQVETITNADNHHNTMQIRIRGQLWSQPVPLELLLAADLDVETGTAQVRDLRN